MPARQRVQTHSPITGAAVVKSLLESRIGKEVEISCGGVALSGKVVRLSGDVLELEKDETIFYVNLEKIVVMCDARKKNRATGFIPSKSE
jgi:hypothetical protein